jgi:hypothetical protein
MPDPLPPWRKSDNFSVPSHQRIVDNLNVFSSLVTDAPGTDVILTPSGTSIVRPSPVIPPGVIPIMIDNWAQEGTHRRWLYSWHLPRKLWSGYPTNINPTEAWSSTLEAVAGPTSAYGYAYNGAETINAPTGGTSIYGNGVVKAHLDNVPNLDIQPVTPGTIHLALIIYPEDGGLPEAWFNSPNGVSGAVLCP